MLALVAMAVKAGVAVGKPVGVCGEAAADPLLACVLVGLGVSSLSAAAAAVSGVGAKLAQVTLAQCQERGRGGAGDGHRGRRPRRGHRRPRLTSPRREQTQTPLNWRN